MAGVVSFFKTIFLPAIISLAFYLLCTYAVLPFIRRYRHRYNQYLPMTNISEHTVSLRHRISDALTSFLLPSSWRYGQNNRNPSSRSYSGVGDEDSLFDEEEGEGMVGFNVDERRREALERRRSQGEQDERRLSRDLEEGFRDESDEEVEENVNRSQVAR